MKKFYFTVALTVMTALAVMADAPEKVATLCPNVARAQMQKAAITNPDEVAATPAAIKKVPSKKGLSGDYINIHRSLTATMQRDMTEVVSIVINDDNSVTIDGLCGMNTTALAKDNRYNSVAPATGTYNPDNLTITVPGKQLLAKFGTTYDLRLCSGSAYGSSFMYNESRDITFTYKNGRWVCSTGLGLMCFTSASDTDGFWAAESSASLAHANGTLQSYVVRDGAAVPVESPMWYEITTSGEGNRTLRMSALTTEFLTEGYVSEWTIDGDIATATAQPACEAYALATDQALRVFYLASFSTNQDLTSLASPSDAFIDCNINEDCSQILFPATRKYWSAIDISPEMFWAGQFLNSAINGVLNYEPEQEPDPQPDPDPDPQPAYTPESLGVIGDLIDGAWNPTVVAMLEKQGDTPVFTGTATLAGRYFNFCEYASESADDWAGVGTRWGAKRTDLPISIDQPETIVKDNKNFAFALVLPDDVDFPATIQFTVDFSDMTVILNGAATVGLDGITLSPDATPVYYNLQGIRVDRPTPGSVYILRTPTSTRKVVF